MGGAFNSFQVSEANCKISTQQHGCDLLGNASNPSLLFKKKLLLTLILWFMPMGNLASNEVFVVVSERD